MTRPTRTEAGGLSGRNCCSNLLAAPGKPVTILTYTGSQMARPAPATALQSGVAPCMRCPSRLFIGERFRYRAYPQA